MGVKNDSTLVFNKFRVIFDPPWDGVGLNLVHFIKKKNMEYACILCGKTSIWEYIFQLV
jgi:hypothetical protein